MDCFFLIAGPFCPRGLFKRNKNSKPREDLPLKNWKWLRLTHYSSAEVYTDILCSRHLPHVLNKFTCLYGVFHKYKTPCDVFRVAVADCKVCLGYGAHYRVLIHRLAWLMVSRFEAKQPEIREQPKTQFLLFNHTVLLVS